MPKSGADNNLEVGRRNLVNAKTMGASVGFTAQYINRLAAAGKIPWHRVRNGAKVYRRYDQLKVLDALKHEIGMSDSAASQEAKTVLQAGHAKK